MFPLPFGAPPSPSGLPSSSLLTLSQPSLHYKGSHCFRKVSQDKKSLDVGANLFVGNLDPPKIKETIEKAFWDGIMESLKEDEPNYNKIVVLVKKVRDELFEMAPQSWKQQILDRINLDILSQVLKSGIQDMNYIGKFLEYALVMLQKLSAPAEEDEMKKVHIKLTSELTCIAESTTRQDCSFVLATVKGLHFVLD